MKSVNFHRADAEPKTTAERQSKRAGRRASGRRTVAPQGSMSVPGDEDAMTRAFRPQKPLDADLPKAAVRRLFDGVRRCSRQLSGREMTMAEDMAPASPVGERNGSADSRLRGSIA